MIRIIHKIIKAAHDLKNFFSDSPSRMIQMIQILTTFIKPALSTMDTFGLKNKKGTQNDFNPEKPLWRSNRNINNINIAELLSIPDNMSGRRCSQLQQIGLDGIWVVVSSPVWWVQLRKQEYRPQGKCDNNNGGPGPHTAHNLIHTDGTTHFLTSSCPPPEPTRRLVVTAQAHQPPANLSQDLISLLSEGLSTSQLLQQQQNGARPSMMSLLSTLSKEQRTTSLRFCERGDKTTRSMEIPTSRITLACIRWWNTFLSTGLHTTGKYT